MKKEETKQNFINDRVGEYLVPYLGEYLFDELSEGYLEKAGAKDILSGVPVPISKADLTELTNLKIARSMAMVIGCDLNFPHRDAYVEYIQRTFGDQIVPPLLNEGMECALKEEIEKACICFRGALAIAPNNPDALYCYGRACKDAYEKGEGEEYVGRFKAESLEIFEKLTIVAPEDERGLYFLGYGYLNLGLYLKARLTFQDYLKITDVEMEETAGVDPEYLNMRRETIKEVKDWVKRLEDPVKIEMGYNHVLAGRYQEGVDVLIPFSEDKRYNDWWPLHYYLGIAYKNLGEPEKAIDSLKTVLKFAPSDINTMKELIEIFETLGDPQSAEKYRNKIKVVERNLEEEKAERNPNFS